jgi:hypothetical protein
MKAYQIKLETGRAFTYITDEPACNIAAAIFERFGRVALEVVAL